MARNPIVEAILAAWYELDHNPPPLRSEAQARLNGLLDGAIGRSPFTREQVLDNLWDAYKDYRTARFREEKVRIAQSSGSGR